MKNSSQSIIDFIDKLEYESDGEYEALKEVKLFIEKQNTENVENYEWFKRQCLKFIRSMRNKEITPGDISDFDDRIGEKFSFIKGEMEHLFECMRYDEDGKLVDIMDPLVYITWESMDGSMEIENISLYEYCRRYGY